jgi:hypothetical protein
MSDTWMRVTDNNVESRIGLRVRIPDVELEIGEWETRGIITGIVEKVTDVAADKIVAMVVESEEYRDAHRAVYKKVIDDVRQSLVIPLDDE